MPTDPTPSPVLNLDALRKYIDREARLWGSLVRQRRKLCGLTLAELGGMTGTAPQTVHKVERGEIAARDHLRIALAVALRCEVADLFPVPKLQTILGEVA